MLKKLHIIFCSVILFLLNISAQENLVQYVDPFIGTAEHGHTFPGATVPFGMVQLSPDTDIRGWDWCSGYHSSDSSIMGFSHTHLSGTGGADMGDIMFMPTNGEFNFFAGTKAHPDRGYRSTFSHDNEIAKAGYYSVVLDDNNIKVELTTTNRIGFHKYTYSKSDSTNVIIDLEHGISDLVKEGYVKIIDSNTVVGYRNSAGWADDHTVYFYAVFNQSIVRYLIENDGQLSEEKESKGKSVKVGLSFSLDSSDALLSKVGISFVSIENAKENLETELPHWNFEKTIIDAEEKWNKELNRIVVEGGTDQQKRTFYTSLYHAFLVPNIFEDVNGNYVGMDKQIHSSDDHTHYTLFSLWDTYRATHPLYTLVQQGRTKDFIQSLYYKSIQQNLMPIWELQANETGTMIGYHAVSVIADAYLKGIEIPNIEDIYNQMVMTADKNHLGLSYYKKMDYIPMDKADDSASRTIEYSYDDWCIAEVAKKLNKEDDYNRFINRSMNYRNLFDTTTGFIRGRLSDGRWKEEFYPEEPFPLGNGEFTEGNSWQYTWSGLHDINELINMMGGDEPFERKLDSLFKSQNNPKFMQPADVTGLIGQYAHGNEPSHHVAYLYNFIGKPYKTQQKVRQIMDELYNDSRAGLCGNEDCGQMSAWYVFSAMGFYPVTPGSNEHIIGSPLFDKVTINLENGNKFVIRAINNAHENIYVDKIELNNEPYTKSYISNSEIMNGGEMVFDMSSKPNFSFGASENDRPVEIVSEKFTPVEEKLVFKPFIESDRTTFVDQMKVSLNSYNENSLIYFTVDGSEPTVNSNRYNTPINSDTSFTLKAITIVEDRGQSEILEQRFSKAITRDLNDPYFESDGVIYPTIELKNDYHRRYTGGSDDALIDGVRGSTNFLDGKWQGFQEVDLDAIIDLGKSEEINRVSLSLLRDQGSWIFFPSEITFSISGDGNNFEEVKTIEWESSPEHNEKLLKEFSADINKNTRYIRVFAKNLKSCPDWHYAAGNNAFIFADEILIEKK